MFDLIVVSIATCPTATGFLWSSRLRLTFWPLELRRLTRRPPESGRTRSPVERPAPCGSTDRLQRRSRRMTSNSRAGVIATRRDAACPIGIGRVPRPSRLRGWV